MMKKKVITVGKMITSANSCAMSPSWPATVEVDWATLTESYEGQPKSASWFVVEESASEARLRLEGIRLIDGVPERIDRAAGCAVMENAVAEPRSANMVRTDRKAIVSRYNVTKFVRLNRVLPW